MLVEAFEEMKASERPKRLTLVATGNVQGGNLNEVLPLKPLEDPSQSWNALTIGGFTRKDQVPEQPEDLKPVVPANHRSPYSKGSQSFPSDLTPVKPEVLFEAGNMAVDASGYCEFNPAASLLAPGRDVVAEPLTPFWATSAAVGVAGNFVGQLQAALPELWPETHRALMVDSARWPSPIRRKFVGRGAHWKSGTKTEKVNLVREFGYGVPDIRRAIQSASNDATMIAQAEIQPYKLNVDGSSAVYNEMHFYYLPWPTEALERLENKIVTMKVSLSYFIEPNLNGRASTRPETYRSFGLRFAMKKRLEARQTFIGRISASQKKGDTESLKEQDYWLLGSTAGQAGSLHCDLWRGHAVDLAAHDAIAVFPVGGWWKSHLGQKRAEDKGRYALVISISAPDNQVDLYSEISSLVEVKQIELQAQSIEI